MVCSMLVALTRPLDKGLITIRHVIVSSVRDPQYLRRNFSGTFLEKATGGLYN